MELATMQFVGNKKMEPFRDISRICTLWSSLSTIAPVSILALKISYHLSNVKFVVRIIEPSSFLLESKLNNISQPVL